MKRPFLLLPVLLPLHSETTGLIRKLYVKYLTILVGAEGLEPWTR